MLRKAITIALAAGALCLPAVGEPQSEQPNTQQMRETAPPPEARIDINHATVEQLLKVPGMTRSWAERIVRFRPYRTKQDLVDLGVMPNDVYKRIKDYVIAHQDKK